MLWTTVNAAMVFASIAMLSTRQWPGVVPSFSRPHVSNDNPYAGRS
jgi:hypothetical protein